MAADLCGICGEWYVTTLEPIGICRMCELKEDAWRQHIAGQIEELRADAHRSSMSIDEVITRCVSIARGAHGM